jgi:hypothetical protein
MQASLSSHKELDKHVEQDYCVNSDEAICMSSQITINEIIDYNKKNVYNISLSDADIVNEVSLINLNDYLRRKNKPFHLCILKSMKDTGIVTLGELVREYKTELDDNMIKKMKIIMSAFPNNLLEILTKTQIMMNT